MTHTQGEHKLTTLDEGAGKYLDTDEIFRVVSDAHTIYRTKDINIKVPTRSNTHTANKVFLQHEILEDWTVNSLLFFSFSRSIPILKPIITETIEWKQRLHCRLYESNYTQKVPS